QLFDRRLPGIFLCGRNWRFLTANAAELLVVDELRDRRLVAAHRALRIPANLELAETHPQGIIEHQPTNQWLAVAEDQFHGLGRLNTADESRQDTEDATFGAARHFAGRRRLRIQATVTRSVRRIEDRRLAVEAEDAAVDVRLLQKHAGVVDEIARREIIG